MIPAYRTPQEISINKVFFQENENRVRLLAYLKFGFKGNWATKLPKCWGPIRNYFSQEVVKKCRERFKKETQKGRMVGGPGWTRKITREFLRSDFYVIPCGAVPKGSDPHGRIIHDYSFSYEGENSLNSALLENSVEYISFLKRAEVLSQIKLYVALDLKNRYRQLPVHPCEYRTQMYSLGHSEHYIYLCMPIVKSNSSKIFCFGVQNWCFLK